MPSVPEKGVSPPLFSRRKASAELPRTGQRARTRCDGTARPPAATASRRGAHGALPAGDKARLAVTALGPAEAPLAAALLPRLSAGLGGVDGPGRTATWTQTGPVGTRRPSAPSSNAPQDVSRSALLHLRGVPPLRTCADEFMSFCSYHLHLHSHSDLLREAGEK